MHMRLDMIGMEIDDPWDEDLPGQVLPARDSRADLSDLSIIDHHPAFDEAIGRNQRGIAQQKRAVCGGIEHRMRILIGGD